MSEEISKMAQEAAKAEAKEEEKSHNKREIIKNIAIIFLSIMLVLTFFSNTIMNYSLPQVSTEMVSSGTIKTQVRGQGVIETVDPYNLTVKQTRTIKSVRVKEGDDVQIGDVIYELEGEESSELDSARAEVSSAEVAYQKAIISNGLGADQVFAIQSGTDVNISEIQKNIAEYDRQIDQYLTEIEQHEANIKLLTMEKNKLDPKIDNSANATSWKRQNEIDTANYDKESPALKSTISEYEARQKTITDYADIADPTADDTLAYENAKKYIAEHQDSYDKAVKRLQELTDAKDRSALESTLASTTLAEDPDIAKKIKDLTAQIAQETTAKELTETAKTDTEARKKKYVDSMTSKIDAIDSYTKLQNAKAKVEKLEAEALGKEITSPVAGKIITLAKKAGEETDPQNPIAVIRVDGKGYRMSFSVDNKQARSVKVGDVVKIEDWGYSDETKVNLVAINPDKSDPQNKKNLVFDISASDEIEVGKTLSVSVGDASASYDLTVPNSAVYNDKKGDFILILQEKAVPFGKRYIAKRVEVTKKYANDDTRTAIEADVDGWSTYVITNSTKPLKGGQQVRLATDSENN